MAIHVRCSTLNFSKLSYLRSLATRKQTNSTKTDKTTKNALIVQSDYRRTALAKHLNRSLALTTYKQDEKRICPIDEIVTSIYPITNSVKSLVSLDSIFSLIGGFTCNHGNKLSDIEHLIGTKDIVKPVALSSDDIILIQDNGSKGRFLNDLEVINEILQKEKCKSDLKGSFTNHTKHAQSESKTVLGDQFTLQLCSSLNCKAQEDITPDSNREPADSPESKLVQTKNLIETEIMQAHFRKTTKFSYDCFSVDVVFENNFFQKPKTTKGLVGYSLAMLKMNIWCVMKYVQTDFKILRITAHPEDQSVRVRWRLSGFGALTALSIPFQHATGRRMKPEEIQDHNDCYSIYFLNDEGKIIKHKLDRVIADEEMKVVKGRKLIQRIAASFGIALGK